jgi:polar amino acid transport system substrate-binding protein
VWHDTLAPLLDDIAAAKVDVALAGISITKEREARFDFSYPMFNAGLQVLAGPAHAQSWTSQLRSVLNASVAKYLLVLLLGTVLAGNVVWFVTRRRSEKERSYVHGIGHGMYKAAAVGLAGDFGSADAQRPIGRFFSIVWVMVGICFVSLFTATVTTQLTVQQIKSDIGGVTDLPGKRVVTVKGSTAAQYLTNHQIAFTTVDVIDQAYDALDNGRADAIVFDAPVLQHHANATGGKRETLVGGVFQREDYGIALPTGSTLRKPVNETLLALRADGTYDRLYEHYFGTNT